MIYAKTYDNNGSLGLAVVYYPKDDYIPFDVPSADYLGLINSQIEIVEPPKETPAQAFERLEAALDAHIDAQARLYRYESIRTMVTYESDPNARFNAEGTGALKFRSACYVKSISIINEVNQGRTIPTEQELIAEMPTLESFIIYG